MGKGRKPRPISKEEIMIENAEELWAIIVRIKPNIFDGKGQKTEAYI